MALLDKIVAEGRSPSVRLQYRGVRALQLMLIGDQEGCIAELRSAISEYKERSTNRTDEYGTLQLARSCELLAGLTNDKELFGEAEGLLRKLLATEQYTPSGRAMLWRDLGDVLLDQGQAPEATDAYLRSLDYLDTSLGRLKVAKGMAVMGRNDRAREYVGGLDYSALSKPEKFDYNTVAARTAVAGGDAAERNAIAIRFKELEVTDPYFRDIRNAVVTELRTPEHHGEVRAAGFFTRILRGASRYLLLQPNICGLGVNVNTILEDAAGHRAISDKKADSQHEA